MFVPYVMANLSNIQSGLEVVDRQTNTAIERAMQLAWLKIICLINCRFIDLFKFQPEDCITLPCGANMGSNPY